ncbi:MAG TPA: hypothetical protein PLZ43_01975 [bacterium]|nr:hypothetical protein [bacterium]
MQHKIIKYCSIRNDTVTVDGKVVLKTVEQPGTSKQFKEIFQSLGIDYPKFYKMDMLSKLAFLAFEFLTHDSGIAISETKTAILLSNRHSTIDDDIKYSATITDQNYFPNPALFVYTLPNVMIGEISIRKNIKGETLFISSNGFSGTAFENCLDSMIFENCLTGFVEYENGDNFEAFAVFLEKSEYSGNNSLNFELERLYNNR